MQIWSIERENELVSWLISRSTPLRERLFITWCHAVTPVFLEVLVGNWSQIGSQTNVPGQVMTALRSLDDLPLMRASVRQDLLQRTQRWREQLRDMGDRAGDRLEGWLDEPPWDEPEPEQRIDSNEPDEEAPVNEVWDDDTWPESSFQRRVNRDEDPWV
jgi:hypothetical protein